MLGALCNVCRIWWAKSWEHILEEHTAEVGWGIEARVCDPQRL